MNDRAHMRYSKQLLTIVLKSLYCNRRGGNQIRNGGDTVNWKYLEVKEIQKALEFIVMSATSFCRSCEHLGPMNGLLLYVGFTDVVMLFNVEQSISLWIGSNAISAVLLILESFEMKAVVLIQVNCKGAELWSSGKPVHQAGCCHRTHQYSVNSQM